MLALNTDINKISRVGQATAKRLNHLGIETVRDLIFYYPYRYDDFSVSMPINKLRAGERANVVAQIELIQTKRSPHRRLHITEALVTDGTDQLRVVWFNQTFIAKSLKEGDRVSLAGKIEEDFSGLCMMSPTYEKAGESNINTQGLVPNYHLTDGLTQKQLRYFLRMVFSFHPEIVDWLPAEIVKEGNFISLLSAIKKIHFPENQKDIDEAKRRLAFDELFLIQLQAAATRRDLSVLQARKVEFKEIETRQFVKSLPFRLTDGQKKASWTILQDIAKDTPMARLLEGDVGSGKTLVAVMAALNAALNGLQSVIMVPTAILARQHWNSLGKLLTSFNINIGLLTSNDSLLINQNETSKLKKEKMLASITAGEIDILIGTHALIEDKVEFAKLSLVVVDEQHRFGVEQRKKLVSKASNKNEELAPHLLSMTATPIPRSLALSLFGDLDVSIISELPSGRQPIATRVVLEAKREAVYDFIRHEIRTGRQAFVICPLIDGSDKLGVKSVKEEFVRLDKGVFPEFKLAMLHGKMKPAEKDKTMQDFLDNKIQVLVSTSVVEVGVDVPNATIMVIEGADRFGLAQLHQFRGRVGRGDHKSYCFLSTDSNSDATITRLEALVKYNDGFTLAKIDLKMRGPGEVYGTAQKGFPELKIASLFDYELVQLAKQMAIKLIEIDPSLHKWQLMLAQLGEWERRAHLE